MKLYYDLPPETIEKIRAASSDPLPLYIIPYDVDDSGYLSDGYMVFTQRHILRLKHNEIDAIWKIEDLSNFAAEKLYGNAGFFAMQDGSTVCLCRFSSGRHLKRYSVMVHACELLAKGDLHPDLAIDEPEEVCPTCGRRYLKGTKFCPFCRKKSEIYLKLWGMTKGMRFMLCFPLIAAAISMVLRFVIPIVQAKAINGFIVPEIGTERGTIAEFLVVVAAIVTLDIVQRGLGVIQGRISAISGNRFTLRLREQLFAKLQTLSMSSLGKKSTGDLMGRINNDVGVVQNFVTNLLPNYFSQVFSFIFALILLICMNPLMCLFVFIPLPIAVFAITRFWGHMHRRWRRAWILRRRSNTFLQDTLNGIRVVKTYGNEKDAIEKFDKATTDLTNQEESNGKTFDTFFPIIGFVLRFGSYLILLYGNLLLFGGSMSVGTLNQFNSYANILYEPLMQINQIPRNITEFFTSLSKVLEILEEEPDIIDNEKSQDVKLTGDIKVKNITFGYESFNPVLEHVSVEVKPGQMLGIVGHSGCGKTTLINLIMRLYDVNEGKILMDGVDIRDIPQQLLRSQIGVVLQETHLFSGTIRENIRYSKPDATNEEVVRAAKLANAHDFIVNLPEGYNTIVGEKGYSLSGGERQRVAIARALIHDPSILILDEATAALDTETEKMIQDALDRLTENRTTLAIAHRLSTLRNADKLLVLDHGRVAEFGTHAELLEKKGIYYKLVMAQTEAAISQGKEFSGLE